MKIAVVGAGISGLGSAWILAQKHEVHLFESDSRLGGHANTVFVKDEDRDIPMDTGFLVYNELTYPHFSAFLKSLNVETCDSDMSLSIQVLHKGLEWAGTNLNSVFGQRRNLLRPRFLRMLREILRFHREAKSNVELSSRQNYSLKELLDARQFSFDFRKDYLMPMGAAIWSSPENRMFEFPAETFLSFFLNHRLLQVNNRPVWRTIRDGSIRYVEKVASRIPHRHLNSPVDKVVRENGGVRIVTCGQSLHFDKVIMATHAEITAKILEFENQEESRVISAIRDHKNTAVLHKDVSAMPKRKRCWASWNVMGSETEKENQSVSLNYYLNRLQPLQTKKDYFVTLNPMKKVQHELMNFSYSHPLFDRAAIQAQADLPKLQGKGGVYFAGAWSRYGFHEDGLLSAVKVGEHFGLTPPWAK